MDVEQMRWRGVMIAALILGFWGALLLGSLGGFLPGGVWFSPVWLLALTFAYTGVFITAHDAMHGLVAPFHPTLNRWIGRWCLWLFAAMSYVDLRRAHVDHHSHPSTEDDPDFHEGPPPRFFRWYLGFLFQYVTWGQVIAMGVAFNVLHHLLEVELWRLWVFWVAPQILSTLQLFYVGTYLPHKTDLPFEGEGPRRARSVNLPPWLSFLACYHFGYHYEHHAWPHVPWWMLSQARRQRQKGEIA